MDFFLERDGEVENIMLGTGGSVANILSVGLRFFANFHIGQEQAPPLFGP